MRILLVEDQVAILHSLKKGLEENGYTVEIAIDGKEGLNMALSNPYHVIVVDVMLPSLNGIEICKQIRASGNQTPIMFLSALDYVQDKITGLEAGADDYMAKPFSFEELMARIKVIVRRNNSDITSKRHKVGSLEIDLDTRQAFRQMAFISPVLPVK